MLSLVSAAHGLEGLGFELGSLHSLKRGRQCLGPEQLLKRRLRRKPAARHRVEAVLHMDAMTVLGMHVPSLNLPNPDSLGSMPAPPKHASSIISTL